MESGCIFGSLARWPRLDAASKGQRTVSFIYRGCHLPPQVMSTLMPFLFINAIDCLAFFTFLYLLIAIHDHRRRRGLSYPPGPPLRPVIGNLFDVPKEGPWIAYTDMSKKYGVDNHSCDTSHKLMLASKGDVFCLRIFGQVIVVLCSVSAIKDLLEKRGEIYSDKSTLPIVEMYVLSGVIILDHPSFCHIRTEMDWPLFNISEGEIWREGRRLLDRSLRPGATMSYRQMIQENARGFLVQLLTTPNEFRHHIKLSVASPH
jgi:hypothetical protein